MATYPESPVPIYPLTVTPRFKTITSGMDSGSDERTAKWLYPKYDVAVRYESLSATEVQTLWDFYLARKGGYEAFYVYDLSLLATVTKTHTTQYMGTGDATTTTFDVPGRSTSSHDVFVDAVEIADADYTVLTGGGSSSADRIQFDTAPAAGEILTVSFAGYLRMRVCFAQDQMDFNLFMINLFSTGVEMRGLAAA